MVTDDELRQIMPTLPSARRAQLLGPLQQAMAQYGINTRLREAAFLATLAVESAEMRLMVENLNYSAQRLLQVFPKYFKTAAQAQAYGRQPERIANRVYANRMGNGDEASGDGWRYRGRGVIQITGRDNYRRHGSAIGVDIENNPDLAAEPDVAFRIAGAFWQSNGCNQFADQGNFGQTQKIVNGRFPPHGWPQRQQYYNRALQVLSSGDAAAPQPTRGISAASINTRGPVASVPSDLSRGIYPGEEFGATPPTGPDGDAGTETRAAKKATKKTTAKSSKKSAGKGGAKKSAATAKKGAKKLAAKKSSGKKAASKKGTAKKAAAKKSGAKKVGGKKSGGRKK